MPIHVTQKTYQTVVGVTPSTVWSRFKDLPHTKGVGARNYHLAAVLPTIRASEKGCIRDLFEVAKQESGPYFVGEGVLPACHRLVAWLDAAQGERLYRLQVRFTDALVRGLQTSHIFEHLDALRLKLILHPGILRFVVLGDAKDLPDFTSGWAVGWSLVNARYEPVFAEQETT